MRILLCKYCKELLNWEDILDREGGFDEKYLLQRELWHCNFCDKDYIIERRGHIKDTGIITFEEA